MWQTTFISALWKVSKGAHRGAQHQQPQVIPSEQGRSLPQQSQSKSAKWKNGENTGGLLLTGKSKWMSF